MSSTTSTSTSGVGVIGLLGVVFVTLKLLGITEVATWSWWWVTLPFWGGIAFVSALLVVLGLIQLAIWVSEKR